MRIRALPPNETVRKYIADRDCVFVVDQNRDAQMATVLRSEYPDLAPRIHSICHYNGLPIDAQTIIDGVLAGK